jgi:hypothetical protein
MGSEAPKDGGLGDYRAAAEKLSPALRDTLYRVFSRARLPEDDPLWGLLVADAELLQAFLGGIDERFSQLSQQSEALKEQLRQQHDQLRRDEQATRQKHLAAADDRIEEIRRRQSDLAARESQGWQSSALKYGVVALAAVVLGGWLVHRFDDQRVAEANGRVEELMQRLPYAAQLEVQLEQIGASLGFRRVPKSGYFPARQELVLSPGPGFRPNGAHVDPGTGAAVISFPE